MKKNQDNLQQKRKKIPISPEHVQFGATIFAQKLKILGDFRSLFLIHFLQQKPYRFREIQRTLGINPVTLTHRLKNLESLGLILREAESIDKQSVLYSLTQKGKEFTTITNAIEHYIDKYLVGECGITC